MADKSIRAQSAVVAAMAGDWGMIDALMAGTAAMRIGAKKWLPQWPMEERESYEARLKSAVLHPVFKRTVLVNAARPFSRPIALNDAAPARIIDWTNDIDMQGSPLAAFAVRVMQKCLSNGLTGVLVEYPRVSGIRTQAEEKQVGARPYCVEYSSGQILGWKTQAGAGALQLTQLRLLEFVDEDAGEYGTKSIEQVRVLLPGRWQTYREDPTKNGDWVLTDEGVTSLDFIPFVFFYGMRRAFGIGESPLSDLAHQNVEHWQSASDQQTILHVARVPILFARMFGEGTLKIGAGAAAQSENEKAELMYVEHTGAAIEAGQTALDKLEDRMRATGAELISLKPGYTTATEVSADGEATKSLLQQIVENFEESLEEALEYMAAYTKEEGEIEVEIYKEFGIGSDSDPQALDSAVGTKSISRQTHFEELQRRDLISTDLTWEDELARLAKEASQTTSDEVTRQKALNAVTPAPA